MHFTGTIWRPPYEAWSALLQVTAGCTHHKCKFCTLYDVPFQMSPFDEIETDLQEICTHMPDVTRLFLTGANPFVLSTERLKAIANLAKQYLQKLRSIGCFARITDISSKTTDDLKALCTLGYDRITIGMETGDDKALTFMRKGYTSRDILEQCHKLDLANIRYNLFYLTGIYGSGKSDNGVRKTAEICNQLHPEIIGASMLTVYPESELYQEILQGNWQEESETEKLQEMRTLIELLDIPTHFAALGASNLFHLQGSLPREKADLIHEIDTILEKYDESVLRNYRVNLKHL
ncbi:MAG: radical SAM protein [Oscillospiraceae bacterium]|nr:radical SAM protein [Oscillospiraceae bacterium]